MTSEIINSKSCFIKKEHDVSIESRSLEHNSEKVLVRVEAGGICGSDIHYYQHGRAGASILKEPMIIGHEFVGRVETAPQGSNLKAGQKVVVNPSMPCHECEMCKSGRSNHCKTMRFMGSAQYFPHTQGGFTEYVSVLPEQCFPYSDEMSPSVMAFSEPLSVAIHSINMVGESLVGKKVLVIGAGTIGGLIIAAAKASGALEVIACDVSERSQKIAVQMGAKASFDPREEKDVVFYQDNSGYFDVVFEASGVVSAIESSVLYACPKGTIVQLGMGNNEVTYPIAKLLGKEIKWVGSFRFHDEFSVSVNWLETKRIDPRPLISSKFKLDDVEQAIITAANKAISTKVIVEMI